MVSYDADYTKTQRDTLLSRRLTLKNRVDGTAWTAADIDILKKLILDLLNFEIDDPELTAEDREYSRGLNADGLPNVPEYLHELLMATDDHYFAAWAYDHSEEFQEKAETESWLMSSVLTGQTNYPYREADPEIVDRSLFRNGLRDRREGEPDPPPVLGRQAPRFTLVASSVYTEAGNSAPGGTLSFVP